MTSELPTDGSDARRPERRPRLVGQLRSYIEIVPTGPVAILGVRLEPAALLRLVGSDVGALTGTSIPLDTLGLRELAELEERLHETSSWNERIRLLEETLAHVLFEPRDDDELVEEASNLMRRTGGRHDVARVARHFGTSTRTLERRFAKGVGLSPKLYSRQMRLQRVFSLLDEHTLCPVVGDRDRERLFRPSPPHPRVQAIGGRTTRRFPALAARAIRSSDRGDERTRENKRTRRLVRYPSPA